MPQAVISPARSAVSAHLTEQVPRFPELALHEPDTSGLDPRDAALAHAINGAVVRRWLTLEAVFRFFLRRPFRESHPATQAALLAGAAQLLFLDRIPAHAAIHESVEYVKDHAPKTATLVNAVLRSITRLMLPADTTPWNELAEDRASLPQADGRRIRFREAVLPVDPIERLADVTSTPTPLVRRWAAEFGADRARELALHSLVIPPTVLNLRYAPAGFAGGNTQITPHAIDGFGVWNPEGADLRTTLSKRDNIWVQDPASAQAVRIARGHVRGGRDALILDLCAGQGTKTRQLAAEFPDARILATDTDDRRRAVLRATFAANPRVRVATPSEVGGIAAGKAAVILLDVPCSNSGVLPRRPEAKYRWTPAQLMRLTSTQREILDAAIPMLGLGGALVYSTCSIDREENEDQARRAEALGLTPVTAERTMPAGQPGDPPTAYHDASFVAVLGKR